MTENERYRATMDALHALAENPNETPARRAKAREAWLAEVSRGGSGSPGRPVIGKSLAAEERTERAYEGQVD